MGQEGGGELVRSLSSSRTEGGGSALGRIELFVETLTGESECRFGCEGGCHPAAVRLVEILGGGPKESTMGQGPCGTLLWEMRRGAGRSPDGRSRRGEIEGTPSATALGWKK